MTDAEKKALRLLGYTVPDAPWLAALKAVWGACWYGAVFSTMWMLTSKLFKWWGWI